ncbi:Cat eye syndrome critical region protein [Actinidia chinensis var. chinensis]|uniref:Cat eye syndrome critical region protein n=1 Tax=Actinidia chinensis var. chinensis TaxID=1590841 RepID=A0A2R6RTW3_ACTCC|nr:Cat eye syndrome critical region protein [Actinidia chinensis var. chinensis]
MRFLTAFKGSPNRNRPPLSSFQPRPSWRFFSQAPIGSSLSLSLCNICMRDGIGAYRSSYGVAFDIDGVSLRGRVAIGGSPQALRRLYGDSGNLKIPFLFLTNGK